MKYDAKECLNLADQLTYEGSKAYHERIACESQDALRSVVAEAERLRTEGERVEAMIENPLFLLAVKGGASIDDIRQFIREAKQVELDPTHPQTPKRSAKEVAEELARRYVLPHAEKMPDA